MRVPPSLARAHPSAEMPHTVVFDFDLTMVDVNSDTFVPERVCPPVLAFIDAARRETQWTALMAEAARRMRAAGVTRAQIAAALRVMPCAPELPAAVRAARAAGAALHVVSDANTIYIQEFLQDHGLAPLFDSIVTNPARWECAEGGGEGAEPTLVIEPFHALGRAPHGCALCPTNLCKGAVLDALGLSRGEGGGGSGDAAAAGCCVIYCGDGGGDLCPALRLGSGDLILAREGFPLARRLRERAGTEAAARAEVVEWKDGAELAGRILARLGLPLEP